VFTAPGDLATPPHELAATHGGEASSDMTRALAREVLDALAPSALTADD
jgi:hypothetical protein